MKLTRESGDVLMEGMICTLDVLAKEHSAGPEVRQEGFEGLDLLSRLVATIVYDDVECRHFAKEFLPETRIGLVPDEDVDAVPLVNAASRLEIDSIKLGTGTEILSPHLEASAAEDSDFDDINTPPDELMEVSVVDIKVVPPLPDARPSQMSVKEGLELVRVRSATSRAWLLIDEATGELVAAPIERATAEESDGRSHVSWWTILTLPWVQNRNPSPRSEKAESTSAFRR
jgi:hypothetical protein